MNSDYQYNQYKHKIKNVKNLYDDPIYMLVAKNSVKGLRIIQQCLKYLRFKMCSILMNKILSDDCVDQTLSSKLSMRKSRIS